MADNKKKRGLTRTIRLAAGLALVAYLIYHAGIEKIAANLVDLRPGWVLAAGGLMAGIRILMALRWQYVLASQAIHLSTWESIRITFIALFGGQFLPGGIGPDVIRAYEVINSRRGRPGDVTTTLILDRFIGACSTFFVAAVGSLIAAAYGRLLWLPPLLWGVLLMIIIGWGVACAVLSRLVSIRRFDDTRADKLWRETLSILGSLTDLKRLRRIFARMFFYSITVQLTRCMMFFCLYRALDGEVRAVDCLIFIPLVYVIAQIPASVGGIGTREGALVYMFRPMGIAPHVSVTVGLLSFVLRFVVALPGLAWWIAGRRADLRKRS